ncbi:uncharacterized protein F4822DRAFT_386146 [Hypoxylon trugodes]|uniref:uncharacterized protein n=1 Tax=Hypoxylon trugodes TaxID=326681 RepID=UPI00218E70A9|nr:uncharacterized protein F4822DRAFT_386146 [Hypoxylon trugodes]KAI1393853.1 hypothetical protein F4822DRAFT_386146 [Hypoxylon trugodes]
MQGPSKITAQKGYQGKAATSPILDLPVELLFRVLSFLDPAPILLFSLTCKGTLHFVQASDLWEPCFSTLHRVLQTREEHVSLQRYEFLQLLADDHPHSFVCRRCMKLHRNIVEGGRYAQLGSIPISGRRRGASSQGLMTFGHLWPQYAFSIEEALKVVIPREDPRPIQLPEFSISTDWKLARLGTSCNNPDFIHGYVKLDNEGIAVGGHLHLHRVQRVLLLAEKVVPFFEANTPSSMEQVFRFCRHHTDIMSSFGDPLPPYFFEGLNKAGVYNAITTLALIAPKKALLEEPTGTHGLIIDKSKLFEGIMPGCSQCSTDHVMTIHNHGRAGVEIVVDVYQDLGFLSSTHRGWDYCWTGNIEHKYRGVISRRRDFPAISFDLFPTALGRSARAHPSAPSIQDVWELHEHERSARLGSAVNQLHINNE